MGKAWRFKALKRPTAATSFVFDVGGDCVKIVPQPRKNEAQAQKTRVVGRLRAPWTPDMVSASGDVPMGDESKVDSQGDAENQTNNDGRERKAAALLRVSLLPRSSSVMSLLFSVLKRRSMLPTVLCAAGQLSRPEDGACGYRALCFRANLI